MEKKKLIKLEDTEQNEVFGMHGHMLDFKKRGSFIRNSWKRVQPDYVYAPEYIPAQRKMVEHF